MNKIPLSMCEQHARLHACCGDRTHRKRGAQNPFFLVHRDDVGSCRQQCLKGKDIIKLK